MNTNPDKLQRMIFLHIPKTAGTTVHRIIERQYPRHVTHKLRGRQWAADVERFKKLPLAERQQIRLLTGHMNFGLHEYLPGPHIYITFVREPIDRVISAYCYILEAPEHPLHSTAVAAKMDLPTLVCNGISDNEHVRLLSGVGNAVPFGQCTSEMLEQAQRNIAEHFPIVGLTERFDESLVLLKRLLGWRFTHYRRVNVTRHRLMKDQISPETRALIENYNQLDIQLYEWVRKRFDVLIAQQEKTFHSQLARLQLANWLYAKYRRPFQSAPFTGRKLG